MMLPKLPTYDGLYDVGITTFGLQVPTTVIGNGRMADSGQHALVCEDVTYNLFYPAAVERNEKKGVSWSVSSFHWTLTGWAKFLGYSKWLLWPIVYVAQWVKIPAFQNAKLLSPPHDAKWPIIIFSHGLAGGRNLYSHYCARLASEGHVVLALEHHDGTSTHCQIKGADGKWRNKLYTRVDEVRYDTETKFQYPFRADQLKYRSLEIYSAFQALSKLTKGEEHNLYLINGNLDKFQWNAWKNTIEVTKDVTLSGHSFGGATVFTVLATQPPTSYGPLPISHAIALDPWIDPVATPGPEPTRRDRVNITVINSPRFTLWKEHFHRVRDVVADWAGEKTEGKLFTIVRAIHTSFSDFPTFFIPLQRRNGLALLNLIHRITLASVHNTLDEEIEKLSKEQRLKSAEIIRKGSKKTLAGKAGDLIIH